MKLFIKLINDGLIVHFRLKSSLLISPSIFSGLPRLDLPILRLT